MSWVTNLPWAEAATCKLYLNEISASKVNFRHTNQILTLYCQIGTVQSLPTPTDFSIHPALIWAMFLLQNCLVALQKGRFFNWSCGFQVLQYPCLWDSFSLFMACYLIQATFKTVLMNTRVCLVQELKNFKWVLDCVLSGYQMGWFLLTIIEQNVKFSPLLFYHITYSVNICTEY